MPYITVGKENGENVDIYYKVYKGAPHGSPSTLKDRVNQDLLDFIKSSLAAGAV